MTNKGSPIVVFNGQEMSAEFRDELIAAGGEMTPQFMMRMRHPPSEIGNSPELFGSGVPLIDLTNAPTELAEDSYD